MLGPCIDRNDEACLFQCLDRESRWAIATIHKNLKSMRAVVEKSYPESRRAEAYGTWGEEATAETAQQVFARFCQKRHCLQKIASGYGAVRSVTEIQPDRVAVETTRGETFELMRFDGKWGLTLYQKELLSAKLRISDSLQQVTKNAAVFDEQRRATGEAQ